MGHPQQLHAVFSFVASQDLGDLRYPTPTNTQSIQCTEYGDDRHTGPLLKRNPTNLKTLTTTAQVSASSHDRRLRHRKGGPPEIRQRMRLLLRRRQDELEEPPLLMPVTRLQPLAPAPEQHPTPAAAAVTAAVASAVTAVVQAHPKHRPISAADPSPVACLHRLHGQCH